MIKRIISGGQTGVDRAALDVALKAGIECGGWCPKGRKAEDGPIAGKYPLKETPEPRYAQRTRWNVRDSDGTLILSTGATSGGTVLTEKEAQQQGKPVKNIYLKRDLPEPTSEMLAQDVRQWIDEHDIEELNIAGPRESEAPGVYALAVSFVQRLLEDQFVPES